jgi:ABC-type uncharacterized transport system involved in gliding motility auxiliary subunit
MEKQTSAKPARFQANLNSLATVLFGLFIVVMVNYAAFRHYKRVDYSQNKYYQLSGKTIELLKSLNEPVTVTTIWGKSQLQEPVEMLLKEYEYHAKDKLKVERVDAALDFEKTEALRKKHNFTEGENLIIFQYKDQSKILNDYQLADYDNSGQMMGQAPVLKAFKGEAQFTATIQALVEGKPAKIYFLAGHGERDINSQSSPGGYGSLAVYIKRENIDVATLNLGETPMIPADADGLVIAGPKITLTPDEIQMVGQYLENKGKVLLLQDPDSVSGLEPLAAKYGIQIGNDVALMRISLMGKEAVLEQTIAVEYAAHPTVKSLTGYNLKLERARTVGALPEAGGSPNPKVMELIKTPANYWGETNFADRTKWIFDPAVDRKGPLSVAALYDSGEIPGEGVKVTGTRLVVVGSSSFLSTGSLDGLGVDFIANTLNWMVKKEPVTGISPKLPQEFALKLTPLQARTVTIFALGFVPGLSLVMGIVVWMRRRR